MSEEPTTEEPRNVLYLALAYICVALGIIGAFLPVLPTVPFLLVSAWAAPKGSPALHRWLYEHKTFGPQLKAWDEEQAVSTGSKLLAIIFMTASWFIMLWQTETWVVPVITGVLFVSVGSFLVTRPTPKKDDRDQ